MRVHIQRLVFSSGLTAIILASTSIAFGQPSAADTERSEISRTLTSVVQVLTGKGDGVLNKRGAGVLIREDGVILTSHELIKDATQVQVRLANGEFFDRVELLSVDVRRGVAALKIPGTYLPAAATGNENFVTGETAYVISNADGRLWKVTAGLVNALRPADEISDIGNGYRVIQFDSSLDSSSNGGILTDKSGLAIGLIVSKLDIGKRSHYAIPLSSIGGLGELSSDSKTYASGSGLDLPKLVVPPTVPDIVNTDPQSILKNAKLFYIYSDSFYIKSEMMENALMKKPEFKSGGLFLINARANSDIIVEVDHKLFTWDYRYTMTDRRTGIVLASEKVTVIDGKAAAYKFADKMMAILRKNQNPATAAAAAKKSK